MSKTGAASHIAIFLPSLSGGGTERVMVTLANGFAASGKRVDLVLARAEGPYLTEVAADVRIVDLDKGRVLASLLPLARYLRRERPDAMLSALNYVNIVAILARELTPAYTRLFVSERATLARIDSAGSGTIVRRLMRTFYPMADGVIAVSQGIATELVAELGLSSAHVTAIANPVDVIGIEQLARERPQHPWLAPGQPPVILAVGRLAPQKDYPTLLAAFAQLRAQRDVRLIILGEGESRANLEERIASQGLAGSVALPGFQPNPYGWMAACDVYTLSSLFEGFPNALIQAMACGAKVVSTDCPTGPREILENGRWGRLVPVENKDTLARALSEALCDRNPPDVVSRAKAFSKDRIVSSYLECMAV